MSVPAFSKEHFTFFVLFLFLLASPAFGEQAKRVMVARNTLKVVATLAQDVPISLSIQPSNIRPNEQATAQIRLRNPRQNEFLTLFAIATYTDDTGAQRQVQSNEVQITVDVSLPVRIQVPSDRITLVADSATFDGRPIASASNTTIAFDVLLPGDDQEHVLQFRFQRRQ